MFKFFSSWKNNKNKNNGVFLVNKNENAVVFSVTDKGKLSIKISLQDLASEGAAQKMAETLFCMNKGLYKKQIIEILGEIAKQSPERDNFISCLILYWDSYVDTHQNESYNNDYPVVPPTKFLNSIIQSEK